MSNSCDNRIKLREVLDEDLPTLYHQQLDPDACEMAGFPPRGYDDFMAHWAKVRKMETAVTRAILFDGQVAGNIGSWEEVEEREVGYWLGKEFWGRGIATAALKQFVEILQFRLLFGYTAKSNIGSFKVLEKCGFKVDREERMALRPGGNEIDVVILKLTDPKGV